MMAQFLDYQGALNNILMNLHWISSPIHFIDNQASPLVARITVIIVNMWIGIPVSMLVSTAIIQNLHKIKLKLPRLMVLMLHKFSDQLLSHKSYLLWHLHLSNNLLVTLTTSMLSSC